MFIITYLFNYEKFREGYGTFIFVLVGYNFLLSHTSLENKKYMGTIYQIVYNSFILYKYVENKENNVPLLMFVIVNSFYVLTFINSLNTDSSVDVRRSCTFITTVSMLIQIYIFATNNDSQIVNFIYIAFQSTLFLIVLNIIAVVTGVVDQKEMNEVTNKMF